MSPRVRLTSESAISTLRARTVAFASKRESSVAGSWTSRTASSPKAERKNLLAGSGALSVEAEDDAEQNDGDDTPPESTNEESTDEESTGEEPVLRDISLKTADVSEGTELRLTVRAESNVTVSWLHISLEGPNGNIRGGGQSWEFTEAERDIWETEWTYTVSDEAASGEYYFSRIHVENEANLESDPWPDEPNTTIDNS
ncbi:hypothetical protein [Natrinema caseinilyticum]|uniref:hypothetical protein n=1 Tax=Natrinema caseinilyticum TaxID=2961570 RepID=UPI0020C4DEDE|nr:hypothetical protein [Natrinema caseinilyticum]